MKPIAALLALAVGLAGSNALAADIAKGSKVLVIPFNTLNVPADQQWMGKALQESLTADLGREYATVPFEGQTIVEDNATAVRMAREAQAPYAVRGSAHVVNGEVRLTAQMIDAKTGQPVNTAIATGPVNSFLKLEDDIAAQLRGTPASLAGPGQAPLPPQAPLAPAFAGQQRTTIYNPQNPPRISEPEVYPPPPFNDISLAAQNYNQPYNPYYPAGYYPTYPDYYPPVYSSPVYYPPVYTTPIFSGFPGVFFNVGFGKHHHQGHGHDHHGHHGGHNWGHGGVGGHGGGHVGGGWNGQNWNGGRTFTPPGGFPRVGTPNLGGNRNPIVGGGINRGGGRIVQIGGVGGGLGVRPAPIGGGLGVRPAPVGGGLGARPVVGGGASINRGGAIHFGGAGRAGGAIGGHGGGRVGGVRGR